MKKKKKDARKKKKKTLLDIDIDLYPKDRENGGNYFIYFLEIHHVY